MLKQKKPDHCNKETAIEKDMLAGRVYYFKMVSS